MDNNKRSASAEGDNDSKRPKLEPSDGLLDDELNALLNQSNDKLDFNDLPDDLLDSIDQNIATPPAYSRSNTPLPERMYQPSQLGHPQPPQMPPSQSNIQPPPPPQPQSQSKTKDLYSNDPTKLNDALAAAGVDIQHEEEYLHKNRRLATYQTNQVRVTNFLNPYQISTFMSRISRDNGIIQNFLSDSELLELMSVSCERWMSDIITKTLIMSRHRQKGIPNVNKKPSAIQRSELSKELRNIALKQKELEEQRVNRRMALGLEKNDDGSKKEKGGAEESLHRAANATAAMMSMNPSRKKYSWMSAGSGNSNAPTTKEDPSSKKSHIMTARGENGLRYREIRTGQSVTMKDLLSAIENERIGVDKALLKGYSKLRD
ncbi:transcription initiation factor TFIID subunit 4 [[Candida] jaroonii]|uniref:Transcription initiation factor TFIID subunit 4 n=1 Tax=[Candida] jaroonii TaxID=467808 RepID=A0ACA9YDZ2_9ASCO|nr:transcription initiation factor TFIID subunit 4 [[Candida] jaroonii]